MTLDGIGDFLGTPAGWWLTIGLSLACAPVAYLGNVELSTWLLSEVAIILPAFILRRDHERDAEQEEREKRIEERDRRIEQKLDRLEQLLR